MTDAIQQQLIAARKNQILDAAALVFAEKGFHATTIGDIAKRAGIAHGTIYNYFDTKSALLLGIFERMRETVLQTVPPLLQDLDGRAFIYTLLYHPLMALKDDNFKIFRIILSEISVNEELRTLYNAQILQPSLREAESVFQQYGEKLGLKPANAKLIVRAIYGMVLGLIQQHIIGESEVINDWDKLPDLLTDLILNGLKNE
jgi:AcrR family transcriptional regulator